MPTLKAGSGWYEVVTQSKNFSCSMACSSMVVKRVRGTHLSEKDFQNEESAARIAGHYDKWGTGAAHVLAVLKKWKVKATAYYGSDKANLRMYLELASGQKPVIIGVRWSLVDGHMIVSPGLNHARTHWIALDPGTVGADVGLASEQALSALPQYTRGTLQATIDLVIAT